jgi:hypothetical protein
VFFLFLFSFSFLFFEFVFEVFEIVREEHYYVFVVGEDFFEVVGYFADCKGRGMMVADEVVWFLERGGSRSPE